MRTRTAKAFFDCGGCGEFHPYGWGGDCRDDKQRFSFGRLDSQFGSNGWIEVCELCGSTEHNHEEHLILEEAT